MRFCVDLLGFTQDFRYAAGMIQESTIRRVVMASEFRADNCYGSFRGVLDYKQQVEHWKLVGLVHNPILAFNEINLAEVDGVIGFFREQRWVDAMGDAGVAAVNFSNAVADMALPRVANDEEAIGRLGGEHLLERGFAHFGFLGTPGRWYSDRRYAGFTEVIEEEAGRPCHAFSRASHDSDGTARIQSWLEQLPKPVAVMATNDTRGCQLIEAADNAGFRVPDDVAVLGVDNDHWRTQFPSTPMSSIEPDWRQIGYRAAETLDGIMNGELPPPPRWIKPVGIVTRQSTDIVIAEDPVVAQALQFIREHCTEPIGVEDVLDELGVSRRSLENRLKQAIGQTPHTAISRARVDRATQLLVSTDATMAEIARECGFGQDQFYAVFKRITGTTPGQYRRRFGSHRA